MEAHDLPGTSGIRQAEFARSMSALGRIIRAGNYATAADDKGAIGAWKDDLGQYRCEAHRHLRTVDSQIFTSMKAVADWWRKWLKLI